MKPIKNVLPACEGSERGYSVNRSESTLMVIGRKRDKDKTPVMSTILNLFSTSFQRHIILLEIVALANSKKNRNILKLMMLTSSQWPGVPTFVSKQHM